MAQNPFRQRLIAAGATPMKANQFIEQRAFETGKPVGFTGKPKGPSEWYNENYAGASESLYPQGFRPPTVDSPDFKDYFDVVYGKGSYDKLGKINMTKFAPTYSKALQQKVGTFEYVVSNGIKDGLSPETVYDNILDLGITGTRSDSDVRSYVYKIFDEFNTIGTKLNDEAVKQFNTNKNYKYRLPDPKLRYGTSTNLSAGTVDILSNAGAAKAYNAYAAKVKDPAKLAKFKSYLVSEATKAQLTPWKDEARRRDALKGTKIGG